MNVTLISTNTNLHPPPCLTPSLLTPPAAHLSADERTDPNSTSTVLRSLIRPCRTLPRNLDPTILPRSLLRCPHLLPTTSLHSELTPQQIRTPTRILQLPDLSPRSLPPCLGTETNRMSISCLRFPRTISPQEDSSVEESYLSVKGYQTTTMFARMKKVRRKVQPRDRTRMERPSKPNADGEEKTTARVLFFLPFSPHLPIAEHRLPYYIHSPSLS